MDEELSDLYREIPIKLKDTKNGSRYLRCQAINIWVKKKFFNKNVHIISDYLA